VVSQDPDGKVHCKVSNVACTKDQIDQLNKALAGTNAAPAPILKGAPSSEAQRAAYSTTKSNIKGVALAANGSLTCVTTDGKQGPCTAAHIADLNNAAAAMPGANDGIRGVGVGLGSKKNTANK
jgi:hypothetical protein